MAVAQCIYTATKTKKKVHVTLNCCSKNGWLDRQGAKKFSFTSPKVISTSPKKFLMSIGYSSSVPLKELCLPIVQVKNRNH